MKQQRINSLLFPSKWIKLIHIKHIQDQQNAPSDFEKFYIKYMEDEIQIDTTKQKDSFKLI